MAKNEKKDVTERIRSFEDALNETSRPDIKDFSIFPEDLRDYFKAQYKAVVITEALNEGKRPDWTNEDQKKWVPWFGLSSGVFVFRASYYYYSLAAAGNGSRLCLNSSELAKYSGIQFPDVWNEILLK